MNVVTEFTEPHGPTTQIWVDLKRKCVVCRRPINVGDMYRMCFYRKDLEEANRSGAVHDGCHTTLRTSLVGIPKQIEGQ